MSDADLAKLGLVVIVFLGYMFVTVISGFIFSKGDEDVIPIIAWIVGAIIHTATVVTILR